MMQVSGSNRVYTRKKFADGHSVIRVEGTCKAENIAFITLSRHFAKQGLPVPQILSVSRDKMSYTQEDLGDTLLFDYIESGRTTGQFSSDEVAMLKQTIRTLAHIQIEGARDLDWSVCYPIPAFDRRSIMWDLNYFKYDFLKLTGIEIDEVALEADFERMVSQLLSVPYVAFMYRDFQSRNVMIKDDQPYFIDFQGGRRGPVFYDLASFLWQAKANYPQELREELVDTYIDELKYFGFHLAACRSSFRKTLDVFVLFRQLQVLGAYGFRGLFEGKQHFVESIPFAKQNIKALFQSNKDLKKSYPYIYKVLC